MIIADLNNRSSLSCAHNNIQFSIEIVKDALPKVFYRPIANCTSHPANNSIATFAAFILLKQGKFPTHYIKV